MARSIVQKNKECACWLPGGYAQLKVGNRQANWSAQVSCVWSDLCMRSMAQLLVTVMDNEKLDQSAQVSLSLSLPSHVTHIIHMKQQLSVRVLRFASCHFWMPGISPDVLQIDAVTLHQQQIRTKWCKTVVKPRHVAILGRTFGALPLNLFSFND